jgi:hypothetical protein
MKDRPATGLTGYARDDLGDVEHDLWPTSAASSSPRPTACPSRICTGRGLGWTWTSGLDHRGAARGRRQLDRSDHSTQSVADVSCRWGFAVPRGRSTWCRSGRPGRFTDSGSHSGSHPPADRPGISRPVPGRYPGNASPLTPDHTPAVRSPILGTTGPHVHGQDHPRGPASPPPRPQRAARQDQHLVLSHLK